MVTQTHVVVERLQFDHLVAVITFNQVEIVLERMKKFSSHFENILV